MENQHRLNHPIEIDSSITIRRNLCIGISIFGFGLVGALCSFEQYGTAVAVGSATLFIVACISSNCSKKPRIF